MRRLAKLTAVYVILQSMGGLSIVDRTLYGGWDAPQGDPFTAMTNVVSIVASLVLLYTGRRKFLTSRWYSYSPFIIVLYMLMSAAWSAERIDTVKRAINYATVVTGAMGMAFSLEPIEIMQVTVAVCGAAGAVSLALYPTASGNSYLPTGQAYFRGIFGFKNALGEAMSAGVLAGVYCSLVDTRKRLIYIMATVFMLVMTVICKSATSMLMAILYIFAMPPFVWYKRGGIARIASVFCFASAGLILCVLIGAPDVLLEMLGKDPTLTGRTDLWPYVIEAIWQKPFLGWGFAGFWSPSNPASVAISAALGWEVPEAHNGVLEFLLQLGFLGTGLVAVIICRNFVALIRYMRVEDYLFGSIYLLFFFSLVMMSVSEAVLMSPGQIETLQFFLFDFICGVGLDAISRGSRLPSRRTSDIGLEWPGVDGHLSA